MSNSCEHVPFNLTLLLQFLYSDFIARSSFPVIPYSGNASHSLFLGTLSYAFSKSRNAMYNSLLYSQNFSHICFNVNMWSVVLLPPLKPHCSSPIRLSTIRLHLLSSTFAYTFPGTLSSVIPL